VTHKTLDTRY